MTVTVAGHARKPHIHAAQDTVYYGLKGAGRVPLGDSPLILALVASRPTQSPPGEE